MIIKERNFVAENIKRRAIEDFLENEFSRAGYSHADIQRTPLTLRITVHAQKPGMIIGRGGKTIDAITEVLKTKFGLENPQLDVQEIEDPNLDAKIVAKQIAAAIEKGINYKRIANLTIQRVMNSGANGIALRIAGKLGGEKSRIEKFSQGYLTFTGDVAEKIVRTAYTTAQVKLGTIGIQVRIMVELPKELELLETLDKMGAAKEARKEAEEKKVEEKKKESQKDEESDKEAPKEKKERKTEKKEDKKTEENKVEEKT